MVFRHERVDVPPPGPDAFGRRDTSLKGLDGFGQIGLKARLDKRKEELVFALEVGVEGAAREAGRFCDALEAGGVVAHAGERVRRGAQQCLFGLGLLLSA